MAIFCKLHFTEARDTVPASNCGTWYSRKMVLNETIFILNTAVTPEQAYLISHLNLNGSNSKILVRKSIPKSQEYARVGGHPEDTAPS